MPIIPDDALEEAAFHHLHDESRHKYLQKSTIKIMRKAALHPQSTFYSYRIHLDGGANLSLTNDAEKLINFRHIKRHPISGVADGSPALYATGIGYLPWKASDETTLLVKCFYSAQAAETVISPTDIVLNHITDFNGWTQYSNIDSGKGHVAFHHRQSNESTKFPLICINGLWYNQAVGYADYHTCRLIDADTGEAIPTIRKLTKAAEYELFHHRFGHPGDDTMKILDKHVDGCPTLRGNAFYKCKCCMQDKATKRPVPQSKSPPKTDSKPQPPPPETTNHLDEEPPDEEPPDPYNTITDEDELLQPGQMFQMDFGFVRGSGFTEKDDDGKLITSLDGYNCYLLIIDRKTRRLWGFLSKGKVPPLSFVRDFLQQNGCRTSTRRLIRTDQGGELWGSQEFQDMVKECKFILEPTAAHASFQNGLAERPNRTLGNMIRCILNSAGLGPEYWSWAFTHSIYLKNRLPHKAIGCTPYFAWSGKKPNAKLLRIFGCPVIIKVPGKRSAKLDSSTVSGIFLGYTATDHYIYFRDNQTKRIKIATHVQFDEAGMTIPKAERSYFMNTLQELGYSNKDTTTTSKVTMDED
jgi:hypothetical protein